MAFYIWQYSTATVDHKMMFENLLENLSEIPDDYDLTIASSYLNFDDKSIDTIRKI